MSPDPPEWPERSQHPTIGEPSQDVDAAIERACGRPGWLMLGTFAVGVFAHPDDPNADLKLSSTGSFTEAWTEQVGGRDAIRSEMHRLIRDYLDLLDLDEGWED
jgi:hypothetical protein